MIIGFVIGIMIVAVFSSVIIWIVGKLGFGIEVSGFQAAFLAAVVISILAALANWLLKLVGFTLPSGASGAIIHLIVAAGFLYSAGNLVPGLKVKGFTGALIGALSIAVASWIVAIVLANILAV